MGLSQFDYEGYRAALERIAGIPEELLRQQAGAERELNARLKQIEDSARARTEQLEQLYAAASEQYDEVAYLYQALCQAPAGRPAEEATPLTLADAAQYQNRLAQELKQSFDRIKAEAVRQRQAAAARELERQQQEARARAAEAARRRREEEEAQRRREEEYLRELERQNRSPLKKFIDFLTGN